LTELPPKSPIYPSLRAFNKETLQDQFPKAPSPSIKSLGYPSLNFNKLEERNVNSVDSSVETLNLPTPITHKSADGLYDMSSILTKKKSSVAIYNSTTRDELGTTLTSPPDSNHLPTADEFFIDPTVIPKKAKLSEDYREKNQKLTKHKQDVVCHLCNSVSQSASQTQSYLNYRR
jgi:hypothetical protein